VNVDKQLTIRSASGNPADTIVQAASSSDHVFEVTADYVNVRGFAVKGATTNTKAGIYLGSSIDHCNISDNNASNNYYGIYLHSSSSNTLTNNTASNNDEDGIFLYSSSNYNTLAGNTVSNNDYGIHLYDYPGSNILEYNNVLNNTLQGIVLLSSSNGNTIRNNSVLNNDWHSIHLDNSNDNILANNNVSGSSYGLDLQSSSNNTLTGNLMFGNGRNFGVSGDTDADFDNNIDTTNLVEGKSVYYIKSISGEIFNNTTNTNAGVIYCIQCDAITIKDISLASNGYAGIFFRKTNNSMIENVSISDNSRGVDLRFSSSSTLTCCTVSNNSYGVYLSSSSNNCLYNNYFNNTHNAYDNENNIWNITKTAGANIVGGSYLGGNYWGDYEGEDLNDDGLGDTMLPYNYGITNGGDHLPLIHVHSTKGDLNSDGTLTPADAAIALEIAAGGSASCDAAALAAADVSGDGCVTSLDALMILQAAAGKIEL
jgi:parallel beta-helix repeat protein